MTTKEEKIKDLEKALEMFYQSSAWAEREIKDIEEQLQKYKDLERRLRCCESLKFNSDSCQKEIIEKLKALKE